MLRTAIANPVLRYVAGIAALFVLLVWTIDLNTLIVLENGVLTGCGVAVLVVYWQLVFDAIQGRRPYSDVRQMTLSIVLLWVCVGLSVSSSIQLRAMGAPTTPLVTVALMRYLAVVAAIMQVTVPAYGLGIFYGIERKALWLASAVGTVAASLAIMLQVSEVFAA